MLSDDVGGGRQALEPNYFYSNLDPTFINCGTSGKLLNIDCSEPVSSTVKGKIKLELLKTE